MKKWMGEAFKLLEEDIDEVKVQMSDFRQEVNGKLDVILKYLTGLDKEK